MPDPLRAVLVGCGGISRTWLRGMADLERLEVVGLVDIVQQAAEARAQEFALDGAEIGTDLEAVLRATQPDVVLTAPSQRHTQR
jgi:predicted dehydrogenase